MCGKCRKLQLFCVGVALLALNAAAAPSLELVEEEERELTFEEASRLTGERVDAYDASVGVNPEELGAYIEGDIIGPDTSIADGGRRWPDGVIPYVIRGSFNERELGMIEDAMRSFMNVSCIRFRPRTNADDDYISVDNAHVGCRSYVGRVGGQQEVNLQTPACLRQIGTPLHEFMHAAGFSHEHNREDRDDYVEIAWDNIESGDRKNFVKLHPNTSNTFGTGYDYGSVMHYSDRAYAKDRTQPTILARGGVDIHIGHGNSFTATDVRKLNEMYNCVDAPITSLAPPTASSGGELNNLPNLLETLFE